MENKIALYIRKSREDEGSTEEETLSKQREILLNICEKKGYTDYDIFEEVYSSIEFNRPELSKMLANIEQYDTILVHHIDRLGRDIGLLDEIKKICIENNVKIETPDKVITFENDDEELLYGFTSVLSDFEYKRIRQRLMQGRINAVELKGKWLPQAPYGYSKDKDNYLHPNEDAHIIKAMYSYLLDGYTLRETAKKLNDSGYTTVRGAQWTSAHIKDTADNRAYLGETNFNSQSAKKKIRKKETHTPLISYDDFNSIQAQMKARSSKDSYRPLGLKSPLEGLIYCPLCKNVKGVLLQKSQADTSKRIRPDVRKCYTLRPDTGEKCSNRGCKAYIVEEVVRGKIKKRVSTIKEDIEYLRNNDNTSYTGQLTEQINYLTKDIKAKETATERLLDLYLDGGIDKERYTERKQSLADESDNLTEQVDELQKTLAQMDVKKRETDLKRVLSALESLKDSDMAEQNRILRTFIARVEVLRLEDDIDINVVWL